MPFQPSLVFCQDYHNKNIWPCSAEQTCLNASESWTIFCRALLCVKFKISADINCSAWLVSTEKVSTISAESDINNSEWNCQCWTCHLTLQSKQIQTNSDTNFFIMVVLLQGPTTTVNMYWVNYWCYIVKAFFPFSISGPTRVGLVYGILSPKCRRLLCRHLTSIYPDLWYGLFIL